MSRRAQRGAPPVIGLALWVLERYALEWARPVWLIAAKRRRLAAKARSLIIHDRILNGECKSLQLPEPRRKPD